MMRLKLSIRPMTRTLVSLLLLVAAAAVRAQDATPPRPIPEDVPVCRVKTFSLNEHVRELDGQWQGMLAASDGRGYFASSTHAPNRGGAVFRYDPVTDVVEARTLTDHGLILDQDNRRPWRAESMAVGLDGSVYFTGDWHMNEGESGTRRYVGRHSQDGYRELRRGQRFAGWRPANP